MNETEARPIVSTQLQSAPTVLFVDDEPNTLSALRRLFYASGYRVLTAQGGIEALETLDRESVTVVVSDMRMPEMNGAQFLERVESRWPDTVRVLLTGYADIDGTIDAINKGRIYRYISKPWNDKEVRLTVDQALEDKRLERERLRLETLTRQQNDQLKELNAGLLQQQEALESAAQRMQAILQNAADAIITVDAAGKIESFNASAEQIFGYAATEVVGRALDLLLPENVLDTYYADNQPDKAMDSGPKTAVKTRTDAFGRRQDGSEFPAEISISRVMERSRSFFTLFLRDITQRKLAESAITYLAHHDMLTGLPNRRLLADRIEQAIMRAKRSGAEFAVMFLDLDNFKPINDTFGHDVGDQLLQSVARRITVSLRAEDTVGRQGGDEFIVLLESLSYPGALAMVVEKIQAALAAPFFINGQELHASASIGIAVFPTDGTSVETLFKNSDRAMYYAKKAGRNNAQFFGSDSKAIIAHG